MTKQNWKFWLVSSIFLIVLIFNPYSQVGIFEQTKLYFFYAVSPLIIFICLPDIQKHFSSKENIYKKNPKVKKLLFLLLISLTISTIISINPLKSAFGSYARGQGLISHLIYLTFFLLFIIFYQTKQQQEKILKIILAIAGITAIYAFIQKLGIDFYAESHLKQYGFFGRSFATLGQPNFLGQFLLFPIWIATYFALNNKTNKKYYWLLTFILIAALLFTQNRASIIGLFAGSIFFLTAHKQIPKKYKLLILTLSLITIVLFIYHIAPTTHSLQSRFLVWSKSSLFYWQDFSLIQKLFGTGLESLPQAFYTSSTSALESLGSAAGYDRTHNIILDTLITQGLFGLSILIAIIASLYRTFLKTKNNKLLTIIYFSALSSILISYQFSFPLTTHYLLFALQIALIINIMNTKAYSISSS